MNIVFQLVGKCDNSNPNSIPLEIIKQWEMQGLIRYLGECQDIRPIIAQSSCIILPSKYKEGVPRSLLEAMSMEKPIITTNVSGCRECIKAPVKKNKVFLGQNGIMVEAKDSNSLFCGITTFLSLSQTQRNEMGKAGRRYAIERFDISKTIKFYKEKIKLYSNEGKTLVFISNTSFGMCNFRLEVLQALKNEGYEIHIIAPQDYTTKVLLKNGFIFHSIKINSKGLNPFEDFSTFISLYKLLNKIKPSLTFHYTIKPVIYGSLACNILSIPNISIITGLGYVFIDGGFKKQIIKKIVCFLYKIALFKTQEVWFLNNDDKKTFLWHNIIKKEKTDLLDSEGINTVHFYPSFQKNDEIVFTLIARMLWDKGIGELINTIKRGIKQ